MVELEGGLGPSLASVTGSSSNSDVAELTLNTARATAIEGLIGHRADFHIKTDKLGSATLTFTPTIEWGGESRTLDALSLPITVVHCKFKVIMTSILQGSLPGTIESIVSRVTAELSEETDGVLTGEGEVTWTPKQSTECLQAIQTISPTKVTLRGLPSPDGKSLSVHVTYAGSMFFQHNTLTCGASTSSSHQLQFQTPALDFEVPMTGGSLSPAASLQIGDAALTGTTIITVLPIP
jgi:hypothetical protein